MAIGDALACALMKARKFSKEDFAKFHPAGQLGRNLLLDVSDVMTPAQDCATVSEGDSVRKVVIEMTRKPLGAACAVSPTESSRGSSPTETCAECSKRLSIWIP